MQQPGTGDLSTLMVRAALVASEVICDIYRQPFTATDKSDGSPVTEADRKAEAVILEVLSAAGLPVLAEESAADGRIPVLGERYFVVDPLDGTKEFIKRNGEFTVNIALVEHGRPVLGVIVAPATGQGFVGRRASAEAFTVSGLDIGNQRPIRVRTDGPVSVVASRSHGHEALAALCGAMQVTDDLSVGSSLKFCLLAEGRAQLYPRFTPTCEWDTAAGQAVLEGAGGVVLTLDGAPLGYGKIADDFLNPFFIAASSKQQGEMAAQTMRTVLSRG